MKKALIFVLVLTLLASTILTVNIPSVSASSVTASEWKYWDSATSRLYNAAPDETGAFSGKHFTIGSGSSGNGVTYYESIDGISTEPVWDIQNTKYICNYRVSVNTTKPVANFSFKVYIPNGTEKAKRLVYFTVAKKSGTSYANSNYGAMYFYITNEAAGEAYGAQSGNYAKITYDNPVAFSTDAWHQADIRIFTNTAGKIIYGMYMDDVLVSVIESTATEISHDDIGINQIYFNTAETTTLTPTTYIKDIKLSYEDYDSVYDPSQALSDVRFDSITVNETSNAVSATDYGIAADNFQSSSQSSSQYYSKTDSTFENVNYTTENGTLKTVLTPSASTAATHAAIQNFRHDLTDYFPDDSTKYMQMSYDVYIPEGTESTERCQSWNFGNETSATNKTKYKICSSVKDKKINIYVELIDSESASAEKDVLTEKAVDYTIDSNKWYRIIYLLKISNTADTEYSIDAEGFVMDLSTENTYKIYEANISLPKLAAGTNGIVLTQQRTDILTPKIADNTTVTTYYDNIISRISDTNFSEAYLNVSDLLPADSDYMFKIVLITAENTATARGRDADGNGSQKIVIAGYNEDGYMVKLVVSDDAANENTTVDTEKGIVEFKWDFSSYDTIKTLKAFMFDGISTCLPLAEAVEKSLE